MKDFTKLIIKSSASPATQSVKLAQLIRIHALPVILITISKPMEQLVSAKMDFIFSGLIPMHPASLAAVNARLAKRAQSTALPAIWMILGRLLELLRLVSRLANASQGTLN